MRLKNFANLPWPLGISPCQPVQEVREIHQVATDELAPKNPRMLMIACLCIVLGWAELRVTVLGIPAKAMQGLTRTVGFTSFHITGLNPRSLRRIEHLQRARLHLWAMAPGPS